MIEEWGKVRRVDSDEGDTMVSASMRKVGTDDSRDATFVRYEVLVDINARYKHKPTELVPETAYGQLVHIFLIRFPAPSAYLETTSPETVILAAVRSCKLEKDAPELECLDIHFYSQLGSLDFIDITNLQALVARADGGPRGHWAIFDRSGDLARAEFEKDIY